MSNKTLTRYLIQGSGPYFQVAHCLIPKPGRLREGERNSRKATYRGNPSWQPRRQRRNAYGHAPYADARSLAGSQKNIAATIAELNGREERTVLGRETPGSNPTSQRDRWHR